MANARDLRGNPPSPCLLTRLDEEPAVGALSEALNGIAVALEYIEAIRLVAAWRPTEGKEAGTEVTSVPTGMLQRAEKGGSFLQAAFRATSSSRCREYVVSMAP